MDRLVKDREREYCLRCKTVLLDEFQSPPGIIFYECPVCHRSFAKKQGKTLCFRWRHPVSLALYPVIFEISPGKHARRTAVMLAKQDSEETFNLFVEEIRLELDEPTQQVRDILDCRAPEEELRKYLRLVLKYMQEVGALTSQIEINAAVHRHPKQPKSGSGKNM